MKFLAPGMIVFQAFLGIARAGVVHVGAKAPDFNLQATDGKSYGLERSLQESDAAIIVFIATKCPYSNAYNDRYNQLIGDLKSLGPKSATFLAINANDTEPFEEVKQHAADKGFRFAVLKDEKHAVADAYSAEKTPEAFLVSRSGEVLYKGRIDDDTEGKNIKRRDLFEALKETLAGKPVTIKETRAFGCSIKRK